jgi:hypothetical protein
MSMSKINVKNQCQKSMSMAMSIAIAMSISQNKTHTYENLHYQRTQLESFRKKRT